MFDNFTVTWVYVEFHGYSQKRVNRGCYGVVYILTNESMPDIVKLVSVNISGAAHRKLINRVSATVRCYYAVEVPDARAIEKKIHQGLDDCRVRRGREFFYIAPEKQNHF